ncbi:hypothetical protein CTI14_39890, partial [Methylobacterium radiotolerans]
MARIPGWKGWVIFGFIVLGMSVPPISKNAVLAVYALLDRPLPLLVVLFGTFKTTPELFANPFGPPSSLSLGNYAETVTGQNLGAAFLNSSMVTVCSVTLTLLIASLAAYG